MNIEELKKAREQEIKSRQDALNEGWKVVGVMAITGILCSAIGFTNTNLLGLLQLPAIILVPGAVIGFFVMIYKSANFKK